MKRTHVIMLIVLLLSSAVVLAQPGVRRGPQMADRRAELKEKLQLTDKQEAQVRKLRLGLERSQAELQSKVRLARIDMKELYLSDKIDRTAIEKLAKQVSDFQYQMKMNHIGFWFSVNNILTPEQQTMWKQHLGQMGGEGWQRPGRHMRRSGEMLHDGLRGGLMMHRLAPYTDTETDE